MEYSTCLSSFFKLIALSHLLLILFLPRTLPRYTYTYVTITLVRLSNEATTQSLSSIQTECISAGKSKHKVKDWLTDWRWSFGVFYLFSLLFLKVYYWRCLHCMHAFFSVYSYPYYTLGFILTVYLLNSSCDRDRGVCPGSPFRKSDWTHVGCCVLPIVYCKHPASALLLLCFLSVTSLDILNISDWNIQHKFTTDRFEYT